MKFLRKINLEINKDLYNPIQVKQGDNSRYLLFNLLDNGVPFDLSNKTVRVYAIKPDATKIFNNLTIVDVESGLAELQLTSQMLAKSGWLKLELVIYEATDILSTIKFDIDIIASIRDDEAIESTNEFSALTLGLRKLDEWDAYFKETSGQIEQKYTTELNNVKSSLEENTINIGLSITQEKRLSIEVYDSDRIQRLINKNPNKVLYFPDGEYLIDKPITINNHCMLKLSKNAIFKAVSPMTSGDYIVTWDGGRENIFDNYLMGITGGIFDGNGISKGLKLKNIHSFICSYIWFKNCKTGLSVGDSSDYKNYEGMFHHLYFRNTIGIDDSIALEIPSHGDHHFTDIITVDYTISFFINGYSCRFTRCHNWVTDIIPDIAKTKGFVCSGTDTVMTDCYADTCHVGVEVNNNVRINNLTGFHNTSYGGTGHIMIDYKVPTAYLKLNKGYFNGDGSTDIFFNGELSKFVEISETFVQGLKNPIYSKRTYKTNMYSSSKCQQFLTLKHDKSYIYQAYRFSLDITLSGQSVGKVFCVYDSTGIYLRTDNMNIFSNLKCKKITDGTISYYKLYTISNEQVSFNFVEMKGSIIKNGIELSQNYPTFYLCDVNENTLVDESEITGDTVDIKRMLALAGETGYFEWLSMKGVYLWGYDGKLYMKSTQPSSPTDGLEIVTK